MSVYVCTNSHITVLAAYAAHKRRRKRILQGIDTEMTMQQIGELLHADNLKSVNHYYGENREPNFKICPRAVRGGFSQIQIIKAAHCLQYQSCKHPGWKTSDACKILNRIIRHATENLPGYKQAPWEISPFDTDRPEPEMRR